MGDDEALRYLVDSGLDEGTATELVAAGIPRDRLSALRLGASRLTPRAELAERLQLEPSTLAVVLEAVGITGSELTADEVRAVEIFAVARTLFGDEATARFGRTVNSAMARVAESAVTMFGIEVEDPLVAQQVTPLDRARAVDAGLAALATVPQLFEVLFRRQVLLAVARTNAARTADGLHQTLLLAVGFADLVGSTAWVRGQTPQETSAAVGLLERVAQNAMEGGARIVKMIGDEVMYAAPDPAAACRIARSLVAAVAAEPGLPGLRVGLAYGPVVPADGDLHGAVVNLAARLVAQAEPGQVLVDAEVAGVVEGAEPLEPRALAGFGEVVPYVLPRSGTAG